MGFYLSQENEKHIQPYIRLLSKSEGNTELETTSPERLIYLLRAAANTRYPELKNWMFKNKIIHVLAIPKNPSLIKIEEYDDYVDYISIVDLLIQKKPEAIIFKNAYLTDVEYGKLESAATRLEYKLEKLDKGIKLFK